MEAIQTKREKYRLLDAQWYERVEQEKAEARKREREERRKAGD